MNNNSNSNNKNLIMKNENLRNMMNKISEDAQRQLNESAKSNHNDLLESLFNDPKNEKNRNSLNFKDQINTNHNLIFPLKEDREFFSEFQDFNFNDNINIKTTEQEAPKNNENFSLEFFMERNKKNLPSNLVTPTDFNKNIDVLLKPNFGNNLNNTHNIFDHRRSLPNFSNNQKNQVPQRNSLGTIDLIHTKLNSNYIQSLVESHNLNNWIKIYNEINQNKKISLEGYIESMNNSNFVAENSLLLKLDSYFRQFGLKTKSEMIICEVKKSNVIDCLHILEVNDFSGENTKIMVTSEEFTKDSKQKLPLENSTSNSNRLPFISEDQFKEGEVILIKKSELKDMSINGGRSISVVSFNDIKQLKY